MIDADKWDCVFVDRIEEQNSYRIVSKINHGEPVRGYMYNAPDEKVRTSIPKCSTLQGLPNENKRLILAAIAVAYNRKELKKSQGIITRHWNENVAHPGRKIALETTTHIGLWNKDTTEWQIFITPDETFYSINQQENNVTNELERFKGEAFTNELADKILSCVKTIEADWAKRID